MEILINENDTLVFVIRNWLSHEVSMELCQYLRHNIKWENNGYAKRLGEGYLARRIFSLADSLYDKEKKSFYSRSHDIRDYPCIVGLKERIEKETQVTFNTCVLNEYRDGNCSIGYHSDNEMVLNSPIIGITLGGSRDFYLKNKKNGNRIIKTHLNSGDCYVMMGSCQKQWLHSVPKVTSSEYRISLTFRYI
jgi:alkylated DNA repair dioxygenase AlkB